MLLVCVQYAGQPITQAYIGGLGYWTMPQGVSQYQPGGVPIMPQAYNYNQLAGYYLYKQSIKLLLKLILLLLQNVILHVKYCCTGAKQVTIRAYEYNNMKCLMFLQNGHASTVAGISSVSADGER